MRCACSSLVSSSIEEKLWPQICKCFWIERRGILRRPVTLSRENSGSAKPSTISFLTRSDVAYARDRFTDGGSAAAMILTKLSIAAVTFVR